MSGKSFSFGLVNRNSFGVRSKAFARRSMTRSSFRFWSSRSDPVHILHCRHQSEFQMSQGYEIVRLGSVFCLLTRPRVDLPADELAVSNLRVSALGSATLSRDETGRESGLPHSKLTVVPAAAGTQTYCHGKHHTRQEIFLLGKREQFCQYLSCQFI